MFLYRQYDEGKVLIDKSGEHHYTPEDMLCADLNDHPGWEVVSINYYTKSAGTSPDKDLRYCTLFYRDTLRWEQHPYDEHYGNEEE